MILVPECGNPKDSRFTPVSIIVVDTIGLISSCTLLKVLFNLDSTQTLIKASVVSVKAKPTELNNEKNQDHIQVQ